MSQVEIKQVGILSVKLSAPANPNQYWIDFNVVGGTIRVGYRPGVDFAFCVEPSDLRLLGETLVKMADQQADEQ